MGLRPKSPHEDEEDKVRIKQMAILWWAQKIYEGAHKQCLKTKAYHYHHGQTVDSVEYTRAYIAVLNKLRSLAFELNGGNPEWAEVERSPQLPQGSVTGGPCSSDADCADFYVCRGGECEPIADQANFGNSL